jgi:hypothetical protein
MDTLWHAENIGESPDEREKGGTLSANFPPAMNVKLNGPISTLSGKPQTLSIYSSLSPLRKVFLKFHAKTQSTQSAKI